VLSLASNRSNCAIGSHMNFPGPTSLEDGMLGEVVSGVNVAGGVIPGPTLPVVSAHPVDAVPGGIVLSVVLPGVIIPKCKELL
jgi:hypothetical protein